MAFFDVSPAPLGYASLWSAAPCIAGVVLLLLSAVVRRVKVATGVRAAAKTWPALLLAYGMVGLLLGVGSAEGIAVLGMRALQALWLALMLVTAALHLRLWRSRTYAVLPSQRTEDPRSAYLPGSRRR